MKSALLTIILLSLISFSFARSNYKIEGNDVIIDLDGIGVKSTLLKIEIWSPGVVKVISTMKEEFSATPDLIGQRNTEAIKFKVAYAQTNIEISTDNMIINVAEDGMVRLLNIKGRKLLVESNRSYEPSEFEEGKYKVMQKFFLNRGEHVYGFGQEDESDRYSLRNQNFKVIQDETAIASPVLFSERGFAFIWDNYSATEVKEVPSGLTITSEVADEISFFVINGPEWSTLITELRNITGKAVLLPKWAYGFHLDPDSYLSPAELKNAIAEYQRLDLPVENNFVDNTLYSEEQNLTKQKMNNALENAYAYSILKKKYSETLASSTTNRTVIPTHINLPGIQQYGTFTKAGIISQSWKSLKSQVSAGIVSTFSGQPHWSTTIGGTKGTAEVSNLDELMVRWYQFASFTPVFQGANKTWESDSEYFKAIAKTIQLRYQLLPYIYSTAFNACDQDDLIMRSLLFDYQDEEKTHTLGQQYLFGSSFMVCPVTGEKTTKVPVYFPGKSTWTDFWTGKVYNGGTEVQVDVTLDRIPLFVKQGSIIPMASLENRSDDALNQAMEIRIYAGANANFVLFEDEGDGFGYQNNQRSKIEFNYTEKNKTLSISSIDGDYPGMIQERVFNVAMVSEGNGNGLEKATTVQVVEYKGKKEKIKFE